ncbi:hypothetical protein MTER_41600 [Mycolicibacter terrae]|uniref:DUF732 domain-containing protein n=1 Tax=Mycolicibacter terrae TaxID=1788 RepID=A0AAD1MKD3_9MYCO|nr:DUF732 domain-containing protein [Mycolicibacter terrae]ORW95184.1 hypothetical protein AWC28_12410 [Mycolicibacter terrae]BBX24749.1 hypothetical protein MTER_41600 [Mycolicibacter terrae]SNV95465.1 Conserved exported protein of uncharacterised function [Mycolicibacter terrae]
MRSLPALAVAVGLCLAGAAPGNADPEPGAAPDAQDAGGAVHNAAFLQSLLAAGITYSNSGQAIEAAHAVCGLVDRGEPALQVISDLKANNPGFTTDGAAQFAAIAATTYCPHQLIKK